MTDGIDKKILSFLVEQNVERSALIVLDGNFIGLRSQLEEGYERVVAHPGNEIFLEPQMVRNSAQNFEGVSQLVCGSIDSLKNVKSYAPQINSYVSIFIKVLFQSYSEFLSDLMVHFMTRQIEDRPLIQNSYIRLELADCLAVLETIKMTSGNLTSMEYLNLSTNLDRLAFLGRKCIKLLGGMSQLKGSVLESYLTTMLVINTYCGD